MLDMRQQNLVTNLKTGGHEGIIKSILVGADESVVITGG
jgi:hypothetical protein